MRRMLPLKLFVSNYEYVCPTRKKIIRPSGVPMHAACVAECLDGDKGGRCAKPGTMCASRALGGSQDTLRVHVWVEVIRLPSGRLMTSGICARALLGTGVPGRTK